MPSILIVDDNLANRRVLNYWLKRKGHQTLEADNGRMALDILAMPRWQFDLVLMDYHMPVMNGIEATRLLREREAALGLRRLPVIAVTACGKEIPERDFYSAGMDAILPKPISFLSLDQLLLDVLSR
ncbi:MAG: response regulator [Azonexus sp.]|nr:response regulator [Azonexus sp.]MCK6411788.1 response regulator [Azonexus sp.]